MWCGVVCMCGHTFYGRGVEIRGQCLRTACLFALWGLEIKLTPSGFHRLLFYQLSPLASPHSLLDN